MSILPFSSVTIQGGFWKEQQMLNRETTVWAVYHRFAESGRFQALHCDWKEGQPNKPHIFWDSDVAKWLEGAAYLIQEQPCAELEALIDQVTEAVVAGQLPSGYFNSYFITVEPTEQFVRRMDHELYCAGHFIEGAIAYYHATGKRELLSALERYVEYIYTVFCVDHSAKFDTPGHQEIELALYQLYIETENPHYYELLHFFIDQRGVSDKDRNEVPPEYTQSHLPVREQREAVGHCVRALYLYSGMQDLATLDQDKALQESCDALFEEIVSKKLYITGGVGSTHLGEAFTFPYDLPEYTAYTETCASIALAMFCKRLWNQKPDGKYADIAEQAIYNTVMSGISLSGDEFFYENPLAVDARLVAYNDQCSKDGKRRLPIIQRVRLFDCSCCPPNLVRFFSSIGSYAYSYDDSTIYTQMYMGNTATFDIQGQSIQLKQQTAYPLDGGVRFTILSGGKFNLAIRIPAWCKQAIITKNGASVPIEIENGYVMLTGDWNENDQVEVQFTMLPRLMEATPESRQYCGRVAVCCGPLVYCVEGVDHDGCNVRDLRIAGDATFEVASSTIRDRVVQTLRTTATVRVPTATLYQESPYPTKSIPATLIPYYAWANRGATDMTVWLLKD